MSETAVPERVEAAAADWLGAVATAREEGFTFFDWLTAVDQTDDPTDHPIDHPENPL